MNAPIVKMRFILLLILALGITISCKKKDDPQPTPALRSSIDYSKLTPTTPYASLFVDEKGDATVDRTEGRNLLRMLNAIEAYCKSSVTNSVALDSTKLSNMFRNKSNAFVAPYTDLNALPYSLQKYSSASITMFSSKTTTDQDLEKMFGALAKASLSVGSTAGIGTAGVYNSSYLVDAAGVELGEVITKSLIGAVQIDYISNVLLFTGLNADNHQLVAGKNYTQLEHNWDVAYGLITANDIYALGATDAVANAGESLLGQAIWENNKNGYKQLYAAFLKGRTAIVNNDLNEVRSQALAIRYILEKGVGYSAGAYILATPQQATLVRSHPFSKGYGFIYATRFCFLHGGNVAFSQTYMTQLLNATTTRVTNITYDDILDVQTKVFDKFGYYQQ